MEDHDARLRRYAQEARLHLNYEEISTNDNNQDSTFTVRAVLNGKAYANGVGKTKDGATQDAAKNALSQLMKMDQPEPVKPVQNAASSKDSDTDYVHALHQYCHKKRISMGTVESKGEDNLAFCKFVIKNIEYPAGFGKTKEEAKREAARLTCRRLGVKCSKETDYMGIVMKYCLQKNKILNFLQTDMRGPAHMREFCFKVLINDKDYPEGVGKTKKEAQRKAAELAWSALQEQPDFDSKVSVYSTQSKDSTSTMSSPTSATEPAEVSPHSMVTNARRLVVSSSGSTLVPLKLSLSVDSAPTEQPTSTSLDSHAVMTRSVPSAVDSVGISDPYKSFEDQIPLNSAVSVDSDPGRSPVDLTENMTTFNYVSKLNEHAQKMRVQPKYEDIEAVGPDPKKIFSMRVVINGKWYPEGVGKNKKEAKQNAAKNALRVLEKSGDLTARFAEPSTASVPPLRSNYVCWLNEYVHKEKVTVKCVESIEAGPNFFQSCKFVIGEKEYPTGKGITKKEAKEEAAKLAYHEICGSTSTETVDMPKRLSMKKEDEGFIEANITAVIKEAKEKESPQVPTDLDSKDISRLSTPLSSPPSSSSDSVIFTESSSSSKDQDSEKNKSTGRETKQTSTHSRFTSEFDSIECLGKGGFGHVYKARHVLMNEHFAIKIVRYREKVLKEVKALLKLPHRNIVRYFDCWTEDTEHQCENPSGSHSSTQLSSSTSTPHQLSHFLYIKMELCEMATLKDWINDQNKETLPSSTRAEQSLPIALQIICGVECIHQRFIHRDLKPANIMFGQDGIVKIGDFGLVTTEMDDDESQRERTEDAGTTSYMAPEQKGKTYNNKVDIFALGLIYLELLWKMSSGSERAEVFMRAKGQTLPEDFAKTFPRENKIILAMLSKDPEERPEARDLKAELKKW